MKQDFYVITRRKEIIETVVKLKPDGPDYMVVDTKELSTYNESTTQTQNVSEWIMRNLD
jgi:hypothetical protein